MRWGRIIKERDMTSMTSLDRAQAHARNAVVYAHRAKVTAIIAVTAAMVSIGLRIATMVTGHG